MSVIPPTGALFVAFLGYNPVSAILATLPQAFMPSPRLSCYIGAVLSIVAAFLSAMHGPMRASEIKEEAHEAPVEEKL